MKTIKIISLILVTTLLYSCSVKKETKENNLPNIILILADDIGYGDFKPYNPDSKIKLPNIESLAQQGIMFTDAHSTSSVCAPSRFSVMTGNFPFRGDRINGTWVYTQKSQVIPGQRTIGQLLKEAGYNTSIFGKYHLGCEFYSKEEQYRVLMGERDFKKLDYSRKFRNACH